MGTAMILGGAGFSIMVAGAVLAFSAERYPGHAAQVEFAAGVLIVGGLSIIGAGLAWVLNPMAFVSP
jgi:hypothetical protein